MSHPERPAVAGPAPSSLPRLFDGLPTNPAGSQHFLLALRFVLVNAAALACLAVAALQGWVTAVLTSDPTRLVHLIVVVFVVGFVLCAQRVIRVSVELNRARENVGGRPSRMAEHLARIEGQDSGARASLAGVLKLKLSSKIAVVRHIANALVLLGLIGTVLGFIVALSGVDPNNASDPAAIAPMISTLIDGMGVALYTTLVGSVLNIWLMINYRVLEGGTVHLFNTIVEEGEARARA